MTEVNEITRNERIWARFEIKASVAPSVKYSCCGSPDRFRSGSTAIDRIRPAAAGGGRNFHHASARPAAATARATATHCQGNFGVITDGPASTGADGTVSGAGSLASASTDAFRVSRH